MDASPPAGDGEKLDVIINMMTKLNDKIESIDSRVKELEMENDESTIALKSESSEKEKQEMNLIYLGFLLPEETGKYKYDKSVDGSAALDRGDLKRVYQALNNHYATRTATTRITLMIKLLTIVLETPIQ